MSPSSCSQFYGACLHPGSLFLVTELMGGGDLYSALRRQRRALRWDALGRRVACDIALGLHYLHSRRPAVAHRDLKSPNILLTAEGVAKIADVGMSRRLVGNLLTAQPIMTPLWAAPEVLRRARTGIPADIWSYGILVWEIATGRDVTRCQPLAMTRAMGGKARGAGGTAAGAPGTDAATPFTTTAATMVMPDGAPPLARRIFDACTCQDPGDRPTAAQIVAWLRE